MAYTLSAAHNKQNRGSVQLEVQGGRECPDNPVRIDLTTGTRNVTYRWERSIVYNSVYRLRLLSTHVLLGVLATWYSIGIVVSNVYEVMLDREVSFQVSFV